MTTTKTFLSYFQYLSNEHKPVSLNREQKDREKIQKRPLLLYISFSNSSKSVALNLFPLLQPVKGKML